MITKLRQAIASVLGAVVAMLTFGLVDLDKSGKLAASEGHDPDIRASLDEPLDPSRTAQPPTLRHEDRRR